MTILAANYEPIYHIQKYIAVCCSPTNASQNVTLPINAMLDACTQNEDVVGAVSTCLTLSLFCSSNLSIITFIEAISFWSLLRRSSFSRWVSSRNEGGRDLVRYCSFALTFTFSILFAKIPRGRKSVRLGFSLLSNFPFISFLDESWLI